jgi:hypothetical protein
MLQEVKCDRCGDELIAPAWAGDTNRESVRNLWRCANCGYMSETAEPKIPLSIELAVRCCCTLVQFSVPFI